MHEAVSLVAEGIYQIRLPLPFELRIVQSYLLADDGGWTVVDAGLNHPPSRAVWQEVLRTLGVGWGQIRRIVLTHAHPDHYGAAGWLQEQSGAPVLLSAGEQAFARRTWAADASSEQAIQAMFRQHGLADELAEHVAEDIRRLRAATWPAPVWQTLEPDSALRIGPRSFRTVATPGHSEGHLALYCAEQRLMLCGDTVLGKISPNISLWPDGPPDPLGDFLATLERLAQLPVELGLPGHGPLLRLFAARLDELRVHHAARLELIALRARRGATAAAICSSVFQVDQLSTHQLRFALAETLAHLEHLVRAGRLERVAGQPTIYRG